MVIESDRASRTLRKPGRLGRAGCHRWLTRSGRRRRRNLRHRSCMATILCTVDAKITPSDVDNKRGYEMTVAGTGFNDGTTAPVSTFCRNRRRVGYLNCEVHVEWRFTADCRRDARPAWPTMDNPYCKSCTKTWTPMVTTRRPNVRRLDFTKGDAEAAACATASFRNGTEAGSATGGQRRQGQRDHSR